MRTGRMRWGGVLILLGAVAAPALGLEWATPVPLPDTALQAADLVRIDDDGTVQANLSVPVRIARRSPGGQWSALAPPASCGTPIARDANLAGAEVCLGSGDHPTPIYRAGAGFADEVPIVPTDVGAFAVEAVAVVNRMGDATVAWVTVDGAVGIAYRSSTGAGWEPILVPATAAGAGERRFSVAAGLADNGAAVVAWVEESTSGSRIRTMRRTDRSGAWTAVETLAQTTARIGERVPAADHSVIVKLDGPGNATVLWVEAPSRTERAIRVASLDQATGTWSVPLELAAPHVAARLPIASLDLSPDGHAVAAWWEGSLREHAVWVTRRSPAGSWSAPQVVATRVRVDPTEEWFFVNPLPWNNNRRPRVAVTTGGRALVTWMRDSFDGVAPIPQAVTGTPEAGWTAPSDIARPSPELLQTVNDGPPSRRMTDAVAIAPSGHAVVLWAQADTAGMHVVMAETVPPASPPVPAIARIVRITQPADSPRQAGAAMRLSVRLRAVEDAPAIVERRAGRRWVGAKRVLLTGGLSAEVVVRPPSPGRHTYRVRLTGPGSDPRPAVVTVTATRPPAGARPLCERPVAFAETGRSTIWFLCATRREAVVRELRPQSGRLGRSVPVGRNAVDLAVSGAVWVLRDRSVLRVSLAGRRSGAPIALPLDVDEEAIAIAARGPRIWVLTRRLDRVQRLITLDAASRSVIRTGSVPFLTDDRPAFDLIPRRVGLFIEAVGNGGGDLDTRSRLLNVSGSGVVTARPGGESFGDVAAGPAGIWGVGTRVIDADLSAVMTRLEPQRRIYPSARPGGLLAVGGDAVWGLRPTTTGRFLVSRVDPRTGRVVDRTSVAPTDGASGPRVRLAATAHRAWIVDLDSGVIVPVR